MNEEVERGGWDELPREASAATHVDEALQIGRSPGDAAVDTSCPTAAGAPSAIVSTLEGHLAVMAVMNLARQNGWAHPEWVSSRVKTANPRPAGTKGSGDGVGASAWQCELCLTDCKPPWDQPVLGRPASSKKAAKQQAAIAWMQAWKTGQQAQDDEVEEGEVKEDVCRTSPGAEGAQKVAAATIQSLDFVEAEDGGCLSDE